MDSIDKDSLYYTFLEILRLHYYRTHILLKEIGIYPGQPPMLFVLKEKNAQSQKELANKLNIKPSTITVMLKRMEKANLVIRKKDDKDQRISRVYITEEGEKVCEMLIEIIQKIKDDCFGNFSAEEKRTFKRLFLKMKENLINIMEEQKEET